MKDMVVFVGKNDIIPRGAVGEIVTVSRDKKNAYCEFELTGMDISWADSDNPITVTAEVSMKQLKRFRPIEVDIEDIGTGINAIGDELYEEWLGRDIIPVRVGNGVVWVETDNDKLFPIVLEYVGFRV